MPELPEVETVCRGLAPFLEGAKIEYVDVRRAGLRYPFPPELVSCLQGKTILSLSRRAKYLLILCEDARVLISHLGMSGSWRLEPPFQETATSKNTRHDHLILELVKDGHKMRAIYNDPRRFGFILLSDCEEIDQHPMFKNLGAEPLGNEFSPAYLSTRLRHKKAPLKTALLDQTILAGLGNIYVCEALWHARLSPFLEAQKLAQEGMEAQKAVECLVDSIRRVLIAAIEAGGSTLRDYAHIDGSMGYFQHNFQVYGREGMACPACGNAISRGIQSGRSTFYCSICQSPDRF